MDLRSPPGTAPPPTRPWFLDVDVLVAGAPLVVLIVVGTMRQGAFFKPDVVVLPCLCLALAFTSPVVLGWLRDHPLPVLAGVVVTAWWLVDAATWRHPVESWRLAATWLCAAAGYGVARSLPLISRRIVALAVTALGFGLSVAGLILVGSRATAWTWTDERSLRFQGPLTYPSAIGLFLLVTLLASLEVWRTTGNASVDDPAHSSTAKFATVVRAVIVLGVVSTDSRGAVAGLVVLLCFPWIRRELGRAIVAALIAAPVLLYGQRDGVRPILLLVAAVLAIGVAVLPKSLIHQASRYLAIPAIVLTCWLLATQHRAVSGIDASWTERGHILRGAATVVGAHPLFGAGPDPTIPTKTLNGLPGIDAFAHNEPLEILLSVGMVGTLVFVIAALVVVRALWAGRSRNAMPVFATALAGGLVDFVWHFPALGLLCGVVAGAGGSWQRRPKGSTG